MSDFSPSGQLLWTQTPVVGSNTTVYSRPWAVAVNSAGDVYMTGVTDYFNGSGQTSYVAEYDPTGKLLWNSQFGSSPSSDNPYVQGIAVDNSGNVYVGGDGPSVFGEPVNGNDGFLIKYNSLDQYQWINRFTEPTGGVPVVVSAANGDIFVPDNSDFLEFNSDGSESLAIPKPSYTLSLGYNDGDLAYAGFTNEPPIGEIYGYLTEVSVPEPSTLVLLAIGGLSLAGLAICRRSASKAEHERTTHDPH